MAKPAIPSAPKDAGREKFDKTVKECLETIMGRRADPIRLLSSDASSGDVIAKINEIIERLQ